MALARQWMTADEFLALPPIDEYRHAELIDGEIVVTYPRLGHQRIVLWLAHQIMTWIDAVPGRGEVALTAVRLSDRDVFKPDVVWIGPAHRYPSDDNVLPRPPELCVEVRSPSTWRYDLGRKRLLYEARGAAELWLVDWLEERVVVLRRSSADAAAFDDERTLSRGDTLTSLLLPGLALDVAALLDAAR